MKQLVRKTAAKGRAVLKTAQFWFTLIIAGLGTVEVSMESVRMLLSPKYFGLATIGVALGKVILQVVQQQVFVFDPQSFARDHTGTDDVQ